MSILGAIEVAIKANLDPLSKGLKKAKKQVLSWVKDARRGFDAVKRSVFNLKSALIGVGAGLLAKGFIDTASAMDNMKVSLDTITKGQGEEWFERLNSWALKMPVNTQKAIESFTMMRAMGLNPTIDQMTILVDTMAALGGSEDTMEGIARALGQIQTKGKVSAEELMQLAERGVPVFEILKEKFGDVETSSLDAKEAIAAIFEGMEERFGGQSEKMQSMWSGMVESLKSYWTEFKRLVMESGVMDWLEEKLGFILSKLDEWTRNGQLQEWAEKTGEKLIYWFNQAEDAIVKAATWSSENWGTLKSHIENVWMVTKWGADKIWWAFDKLGKFIGKTAAYIVTAIDRIKHVWNTGDFGILTTPLISDDAQVNVKPMIVMSPPQPWKSGIEEMKQDVASVGDSFNAAFDCSDIKTGLNELSEYQNQLARNVTERADAIRRANDEIREKNLYAGMQRSLWSNPTAAGMFVRRSPGFETGTRRVAKTGPAIVHAGEEIRAKHRARRKSSGLSIGGDLNINVGRNGQQTAKQIRFELERLALRGA